MIKNVLIDKLKYNIDNNLCSEYALIELNEKKIIDKITYVDFYKEVESLGEKFSNLNLENKLCVLYLPATINSIVVIYACFYAGIIPIIKTIANNIPKEKFFYQFHELNSEIKEISAIITNYDFEGLEEETLKDSKTFININCMNNIKPLKKEAKKIDADVIQLTSGTTKISKGVKITFEKLYDNLMYHIDVWGMDKNSSHLTWMPFSHSYGASTVMYIPLLLGGTSYFMTPYEFKKDPLGWLYCISKYKITHAHAASPNFMLQTVVAEFNKSNIKIDLKTLEMLSLGGEMINAQKTLEFYECFKAHGLNYTSLSPEYGMSEGPGLITGVRKDENIYVTTVSEEMKKLNDKMSLSFDELVSIGKSNKYIHISNPDKFEILKENVIGEVIVSLPSLTDGYMNEEDNTNFFIHDNIRYLKTGDLGFIQNGNLILTGRIKDIIIINSKNISPFEIENCVTKFCDNTNLGVNVAFSIREDLSEKVVLFQEYSNDLNIESLKEIKSNVKNIIKQKMNIEIDDSKLILLKDGLIPKTQSGKINRRECRDMFLRGEYNEK